MEGLVEQIQTDVAGLYLRSIVLPAMVMVPQHEHPYDHATLVAHGSVKLWVDGLYQGQYEAGQAVEIKANHKHEFLSLVDGTRLVCIHHTASAVAAMER
jgi:quercetin dioxygenase-like cupin family protein